MYKMTSTEEKIPASEMKTVKAPEKTAKSCPSSEAQIRDEFWTHGIFGCFSNIGLCCCTFICPCYTLGRNAAALGDDGLVIGILYGLGCFAFGPILRWRVRAEKNIQGSMLMDVAVHMCLPCCSLIQENAELYGRDRANLGEQTPLQVTITRQ